MRFAIFALQRPTGVLVTALALATPTGCPAADDAFPSFKPGEWEFMRESTNMPKGAQKIPVKECLDPGAAMREQNAALEQAGCRFDAPVVSGNTYTFVASCEIPGVGKSVSRSVLIRESDTAYTVAVESEGVMKGKPMKVSEKLYARRLGKCPKRK